MKEKMFIKGMTFGWDAKSGMLQEDYAISSLKKLKETGSEWVALAFGVPQDTFYSTKIYFEYGVTVTDMDIIYAVNNAHELGLKVCLKPAVNPKDGIWRGNINFPDAQSDSHGIGYWQQWFESYQKFICHYAKLAETLKCEMFCVGCEFVGAERNTDNWIQIIESIRNIYSGPLIYNANHGSEHKIKWFDKVDIIGTSAYYPVAQKIGETEENMLEAWEKAKEHVKSIYDKFKKPVVFMEIGCRSASGCAAMPWDFMHRELPFDEEEQANFYSSAFKAFSHEEWFGGFFWWDWNVRLHSLEEAKTNKGFGIYGKKAESVVKKWYNNIN